MDVDSGQMKEVLEEAGIFVNKESFENPTEDFIIHVITEFLKKFNFDAVKISEPTQEQLRFISAGEPLPNIFKVINLHAAISSFCQEIFIKDFVLTDITNPVAKRAKRIIKILFNFWSYVRTKTIDNEIYLKELEDKKEEIQGMINSKDDMIIKIGELINEEEKKLAIIEQRRQAIAELRKEALANDAIIQELDSQVQRVHQNHKDAKKARDNYQARYIQLHQKTTDLENQIVKSPEEYNKKLLELKTLLSEKHEQRDDLNEAIGKKKAQIKSNELATDIISSLSKDPLESTKKTLKIIKETTESLELIAKELNSLKLEISKLNDISAGKNTTVINDLTDNPEIYKQLSEQFENQKKEIKNQVNNKKKLNNNLEKQRKSLEENFKILSDAETEYKKFIEDLQELYDKEILEAQEIQKSVMNNLKKD